MSKTIEEHFRDWFNEPFGYGYGSGERPILDQLHAFTALLHWNETGRNYTYDYKELEYKLGESTTWLLINALCNNNDIDYGTSPRYGSFYGPAKELVEYIKSHDIEDMYETVAKYDQYYIHCFDNYCSCGREQVNHRCKNNPFWSAE